MNQEQQQPPELFQRAFTGNQAENVKAILDNLRTGTAKLQEQHSQLEQEAMAALREVVSDLPETAELKKVGFDLDYFEKDGVVIMRELPRNPGRAPSIHQVLAQGNPVPGTASGAVGAGAATVSPPKAA